MNHSRLASPRGLLATMILAVGFATAHASAQGLSEDFNLATGLGGADVLTGSGFNEVDGWDDGLFGEWGFGGTFGDGLVTLVRAEGSPTGGVGDSGVGIVTVTGAAFVDGGWFAGLTWPDLTLPVLEPVLLQLTADMLGDVPGGAYQLRLEGLRLIPFLLDEDFETVLGGAGVEFFNSSTPPGAIGFTDNWDEGISGEQAFAGFNGGGTANGNVTAVGVTNEGVGGGGAGQLIVTDLVPNPGGSWFAGLTWPGQTLATTDLTVLTLTADIKGETNGGTLGDYMLRIEDSSIDYLAFKGTSTGSFQSVGGPLIGAVQGGVGIGDGIFDPTSGPFSVVVVFDNDTSDTWGSGGKITVDNLRFDGGVASELAGSIAFDGVADGTFQTIGGRLSNGSSTFDNVDEDFENVVGPVTDGVFFDATSGASGFTPNWDDGIEGETAFAGIFGAVTVNGGARALGILSGGVGDSGAGQLEVTDLAVDGTCEFSGWFAGLSWPMQQLPDGPLDDIIIRANVKGQAVTGGTAGLMMLRIEDADQDNLYYVLPANGQFRTLGGSLASATEGTGFGPSSDGIFDRTRAPFTVVIAFEDPCNGWGPGGRLTVDNVFLTNAAFGTGVDTWTVAVSYFDEAATWGSGGSLFVDNLNLEEAAPVPPPVVPAGSNQGCRYLSFSAPAASTSGATTEEVIRIRIISLDGFPVPDPDVLYVGQPFDAPEEDSSQPGLTFTAANLSCTPVAHDWVAEGPISVYGGEMIPLSTYEIQRADATCPDLADEGCWSVPVMIETGKYGDAAELFEGPGNPSQPDFNDVAGLVSKFLAEPNAPIKALAQLQPNVVFPLRAIDFRDIAASVDAFLGVPYSTVYSGPCVCPSTVTCGATPCALDVQCSGGLCVDNFCTDACGRCAD